MLVFRGSLIRCLFARGQQDLASLLTERCVSSTEVARGRTRARAGAESAHNCSQFADDRLVCNLRR